MLCQNVVKSCASATSQIIFLKFKTITQFPISIKTNIKVIIPLFHACRIFNLHHVRYIKVGLNLGTFIHRMLNSVNRLWEEKVAEGGDVYKSS